MVGIFVSASMSRAEPYPEYEKGPITQRLACVLMLDCIWNTH